jgi:hypothetical protein
MFPVSIPDEGKVRMDESKIERIDACNYSGWVYWEGHGKDGYFDSVESLRDYCDDNDEEVPSHVLACEEQPFSLDAEYIVENELSNHHDGAFVSDKDIEELQQMLDRWSEKQKIVSYFAIERKLVVLRSDVNPPADPRAPSSPSE